MDILNNQFERENMSEKKSNKTQVLYLAIAGAGVIILVLLVLLLTGGLSNGNTGATTQETGTTAKPKASSSSSSSTKNYVEGKDYKVEYFSSNDISNEKLKNKLKQYGVFDYDILMDSKNKNNADFSPFEQIKVYYNKQLDWLIIDGSKRPKPGMEGGARMGTLSVRSLKDDKEIDGPGSINEDYKTNAKLVYNWRNVTR
ncbi:hypothetical protein [Leuconostoc citreum]